MPIGEERAKSASSCHDKKSDARQNVGIGDPNNGFIGRLICHVDLHPQRPASIAWAEVHDMSGDSPLFLSDMHRVVVASRGLVERKYAFRSGDLPQHRERQRLKK